MAAEIVHDDDVAGSEDRYELLLRIGTEGSAVDRAIEDAWRRSVRRNAGHRGRSVSQVAVRREAVQAPPLRSSAAQRGHVGLDPGLVDEDQPFGIEAGLPGPPSPAPAGNVGAGLLKGEQCFF